MNPLNQFIERNRNFEKHSSVRPDTINKFSGILPAEVLYIWENYGFGTFEDGFVRFVDPDEYYDVLEYCNTYLEPTIVIGVTALGDLLVWEGNNNPTVAVDEGNRYSLFIFRKERKEILGSTSDVINDEIGNKEFIEDEDYFDSSIFYQAKNQLGPLKYDECYGFEPLLVLGGKEDVADINIVKTKVYLSIIGQLVGSIG